MSTTPAPHDSHGSFITGFTVGMFAGAAGYFLFATKEGRSVRKELTAEWNQAKASLEERGIIEDKDLTLREMVKGWFNQEVKDKVIEKLETEEKPAKKAKKKRTFRKAA